jgi:hypothetical protein
MVLKLEMESFWLEIETLLKIRHQDPAVDDDDRGHVERSRNRDAKYSDDFLPKNFYSDLVSDMPTLTLELWR